MLSRKGALAIVVALRRLEDEALRERLIRSLAPADMLVLDACFEAWASEGQLPPRGTGWRTWLMMAGRNFGKTRAGAEWVQSLATMKQPVRIALVGATEDEVRSIMVEGPSGILASAPPGQRPKWEPSLGRLSWRGGSLAFVYSGENPDKLRGPNHHFAWCDELAKWARPDETWMNLNMSLRLGERPRALVTTTPRPLPLLKRIADQRWTVRSGGPIEDNVTGGEEFIQIMRETYAGTRTERQELDGVMCEDFVGALWPRRLIEKCREPGAIPGAEPVAGGKPLVRVVVGVDPPASVGGDACGIVVAGIDRAGVCHILEDASVQGLRPEGWAAAVARAALAWGADRVAAEANQGGAMVESVLRAARSSLPVRLVHASRGKSARAEPVAFLFEKGEALLAGHFPELEDEMAGMTIGGGYEGPGRSPDRADAMVWAMSELMRARDHSGPRVIQL